MKSQYDTVYYSDNFCIEENNLPNRALLAHNVLWISRSFPFLCDCDQGEVSDGGGKQKVKKKKKMDLCYEPQLLDFAKNFLESHLL